MSKYNNRSFEVGDIILYRNKEHPRYYNICRITEITNIRIGIKTLKSSFMYKGYTGGGSPELFRFLTEKDIKELLDPIDDADLLKQIKTSR